MRHAGTQDIETPRLLLRRLLPELLLLELLPEPLSELQPVLLLERKRFLFLLQ